MAKQHFKSSAFFKQNFNVERENSIIKNVVIVQEGLDKNYGYFEPEFINELIEEGNAQTSGVKSRFGHPNMCKTALGTFIGRYKNFRSVNDNGTTKALADLYLDPITKKTQVEGQGITYNEYILSMAESNPDMFGNSIHYASGAEIETRKNDNGEDVQVEVYKNLTSFIASDLVDSPAATTNLFKDSNDLGITTTRFLDENPQVFELLQEKPEIVKGFFIKYNNYLKSNNKDMTWIKKFLGDFSKEEEQTKDIDITLADGSVVTVVTESEEPQVGDAVNDENGQPVADGTHELADGGSITTEGGLITQILSADPEEETQEGEVIEEIKSIKSLLENVIQDNKDLKDENDQFKEAFEVMKESYKKLAKSVESKPVDPYTKEDPKKLATPPAAIEKAKQMREEKRRNK